MTLETMHRVSSGKEDNGYDLDNSSVSEEEREQVSKIMKKFYILKKKRAQYDKNWMEYYKYFRGVQYSKKRPSWKNSEVINFIWQVIQSQVPLQTDVRPQFEFLPEEPSDNEFAKILDDIGRSDWDKNNWLNIILEVLYDGWIYGTSYSSMKFDPKLLYGLGSCVYASEDPFYVYPDRCGDINDPDNKCIYIAKPWLTSAVKAKYPDRADEIRADVVDWVSREKTDLNEFNYSYFNSDKQMPEGSYGSFDTGAKEELTFVIEAYLKPDETVEESYDEEADDGVQTRYKLKKKYPNGRYVVVANGMILEDSELPYEDGLIPYSKYTNYILPREFFGVSEIEQLASPQRIFNKLINFTLDSWALMGNPVWVVDTSSQVDTDTIPNIPGAIIEKSPGSEVRRMEGIGMNPGLLQVIDRLESWFNTIAGVSDLQSGDAPGGVTASSAIEQLISIQRTRIRQKQRNLDNYLKTVGKQYMNRVFQYYSVPRIFRMTNDQNVQIFRKFVMENEQDENGQNQRVALIQDTELQESGDLIEKPIKKLIIKGNFDVRVKSGSSLPFEIADIERKTFSLFDRGIIDEEEVLDRLDTPNKEKILQRLQERQQMAMQQAQQQGAQ